MSLSRRLTLSVLALVGTGWGVFLAVAGLWLALTPGRGFILDRASGWTGPAAGVTAMAMGQFVFMHLVAGRIFPEFARRYGWWFEGPTIAVFLAGLAWCTLGLGGDLL